MDFGDIIVLETEAARRVRDERRIHRRNLRDRSNPFDLGDEEFRIYFRINKEIALILTRSLEGDIRRSRSHGLPVHIVVSNSSIFNFNYVMSYTIVREINCFRLWLQCVFMPLVATNGVLAKIIILYWHNERSVRSLRRCRMPLCTDSSMFILNSVAQLRKDLKLCKVSEEDASDRAKWKRKTRKADPTIRWE
ncbi:unnamed protein product [Danaus chrysippus]|uniref:(African queen) hypothetical protein n=1 Tax=Danaus chrysippus TaxID=151541 RepID=A0A8J2QEX2_9NEOP|nr:unnamed protein product [Danaus chrysippus]